LRQTDTNQKTAAQIIAVVEARLLGEEAEEGVGPSSARAAA
jgi:hypothetical protein